MLKDPVSRVWLLLAGLTGISWWAGAGGAAVSVLGSHGMAVSLLVLAFFKVRLVIMYFMEVRTAPWPLRLIFEAWVTGVCLAVVLIYLLAPGHAASNLI